MKFRIEKSGKIKGQDLLNMLWEGDQYGCAHAYRAFDYYLSAMNIHQGFYQRQAEAGSFKFFAYAGVNLSKGFHNGLNVGLVNSNSGVRNTYGGFPRTIYFMGNMNASPPGGEFYRV